MKILIVEDDFPQATILANILKSHGFSVDITGDGKEALSYLEAFPYDLIILDVLLPNLDGINLCRRLRKKGCKLPILLLSVQNSLQNKVEGLSSGADDYLVKPFEREELLARIQSLLRRGHIPVTPDLVWGDLRLKLDNSQVTFCGSLLKFTPTEYGFLELFLRHPEQLFSVAQITDYLCDSDHSYSVAAVRSHIKGLRHKLKMAGVPEMIETVYGLGYRLKKAASNPSPQILESSVRSKQKATKSPKDLDFLSRSWKKFRPRILEQLHLLQEMAEQIQQKGSCPSGFKKQAQIEVHQLAGLLGSFGFMESSKVCAVIESMLVSEPKLSREQAGQILSMAVSVEQALDESLPVSDRVQVRRPLKLRSDEAQTQLLLLVSCDLRLIERLTMEAKFYGFEAIAVSSPAATHASLQQQQPDVILFDLDGLGDRQEILNLLSALSQTSPLPLMLVLTEDGSFTRRLEMSRLNIHSFLQKPIDPRQILTEVQQSLHQARYAEAQILIVDDHPQMLQLLTQILEPYGFKLITVEDSRLLWNTLETITPDLLIMDLKMPHINGIDLCQVVRTDPRWQDVPILVLTAFSETENVQKVLAAGADDVVSKDVAQPELVARIKTRLTRSLRYQKLLQ